MSATYYHWEPVLVNPCKVNRISVWLLEALVEEYGAAPFELNGDAMLYLRGIRSLSADPFRPFVERLIAAIKQHGSIRVMVDHA